MKVKEIREKLLALQDKEYRDFQAKLIPTVDPKRIIGTRTPQLRDLAKELVKSYDCSLFLDDLPHKYFDEDQLHAFILSRMKDYDRCMEETERFLPFIDNWATCDQMSPKIFKKHKAKLLEKVKVWIASDDTYTVRFGIGMLMEHFLDDDFDKAYPKMVAGVKSEEYYINMMVAWYFATALAKQYDAVIPYIEKKKLSSWNHNKAIQKSIESNRVTPEHKEYLRSLKVK
ncbi:MAG: DNA alkylation repair protein [Lachnospiraceae bacterium]|nr:DNA alkylation repair protein [Lachnospiraceae bacterium]